MKLATLRTPYGTRAIRIEDNNVGLDVGLDVGVDVGVGVGVGVALDFDDVGLLLSAAEDWRKSACLSGESITFSHRDLAPVIPQPGKIICVGLNYTQHILEMGHKKPAVPTIFVKFPDALTGPFDPVHVPPFAQGKPDYEGELAVVIGRQAHQVKRDEALDYVAGYAIINDYTLRDHQKATSQFHPGKSFYRTAGFGPWLTTSDDWSPGNNSRLVTTVDGQIRQDDSTDNMVFSVAELIEYCSQFYPLHPGDVIATGTPSGVGWAQTPPVFLQDGQTTAVSIEGLGTISNKTVFDTAAKPIQTGNIFPTEDLLHRDLLSGNNKASGSPSGESAGDSGCCSAKCGCGR